MIGNSVERWLLPDGVEEMLPGRAARLEAQRRTLLDLYQSWGYELVMTPLIEYLESLLVTGSSELDLQTFKVTDQLTGRMMGVRADITPQVARIDAHCMRREAPVRLCYAGSVLHTRPAAAGAPRSPVQAGAELYGHAGFESDVEVLHLMMETLDVSGFAEVQVELGHVGVFRGLAEAAGLNEGTERALFSLMQRKALPELDRFVADTVNDSALAQMLCELARLSGDEEVLDRAAQQLSKAPESVRAALSNLRDIAAGINARVPGLRLYFDLSELRGYHYHTGVVFSAYKPGHGAALAKGGRYDEIGRLFGRARPATGFSVDLKQLAATKSASAIEPGLILAPGCTDPDLNKLVAELRRAGERVVEMLPGQPGDVTEMGVNREIVSDDGAWKVVPRIASGD